jgi:Acetyltransferase (GNAT) domain
VLFYPKSIGQVPPAFLYPLDEVGDSVASFKPVRESLFDSLEWFQLLAKTTIPEAPMLLDNRQTGSRLSGMVLRIQRESRWGLSYDSVGAFSNYYSMCYNVVGSTETDDLFALGAYLARLRVPVARLGPFPAETGMSRRLGMALSENGLSVRISEAFGNWIEPVKGRTFETYFATRPSQLINTYERKLRALEKLHRWHFRMIQADDEDLKTSIEHYLKVYEVSWKPKEDATAFIPAFMRLCAQNGLLRLGILYVNDEAVAAQMWLRDHDSAIIYKLAHSPQYEKFSVGLLLTVEMMRHAFDTDKVNLIDFGSGDDPYKAQWMSERRSRETITAYNRRTSLGQIASLKP